MKKLLEYLDKLESEYDRIADTSIRHGASSEFGDGAVEAIKKVKNYILIEGEK